jgi:small subunit ribosomal protein S18
MAKQKRPTTRRRKPVVAKECYFCKEHKVPSYIDGKILERYMTDRGKIIGRSRSGLCATHQNRLTAAIKHARHLALLPFIVRG